MELLLGNIQRRCGKKNKHCTQKRESCDLWKCCLLPSHNTGIRTPCCPEVHPMNIARGLHTTVTNLQLRRYRGEGGRESTESGWVKDDCTHEIKPFFFVSDDFWNAGKNFLLYFVERIRATIKPYRPKTSAKMRIRIMPTNSRGCCAVPRTPASPTMPMANPAARPLNPTLRPAPSCKKLLYSVMSGVREFAISTATTSP